jgi:hypothetical protein
MPTNAPLWNASQVIHACPTIGWAGEVWRTHSPARAATDASLSIQHSGRYHRGLDQHGGRHWPALYTSLDRATSAWEYTRLLLRIIGSDYSQGKDLNTLRTLLSNGRVNVTALSVSLSVILDIRDPVNLGLSLADITNDYDFSKTQQIAQAAIDAGAEAILAPSASGNGFNLIIFTESLRSTSTIRAGVSHEIKLLSIPSSP